jgi:cytochrome c-type biogenesis protein
MLDQFFSYLDSLTIGGPIPPSVLFPLAFAGGLVASVSPCCLSMLPVNLSYIGSQNFQDRKDALVKAASFVIGVATTLSLLGFFSSFATFVLVQYRSFFVLGVGALMVVMGLSLLNLIYLPFSKLGAFSFPKQFGPFGVGLSFGLVGSPCSTPIMFSVLAAAATTQNQLISVMTMSFYALGYSLLIFTCCLMTGLVKQSRQLKSFTHILSPFAGIALLLIGLFYSLQGVILTAKRFS